MQDSNPPEDSQDTSTGHGRKEMEGEAGTAQDQEGITARELPRAATAFPSVPPPAVEFLESKLFYPQQTLGINHLVFMLQLKYRHCPPPQSCADHSEEDAQGGSGHHPALGRPGNAKGHRIHQSQALRAGQEPLPSPHTPGITGDAAAEQAEHRDHQGKAGTCAPVSEH